MNTARSGTYAEELARLEHEDLYRRRRIVETACAPEIEIDGRRLVSFCSNDYLGLASHPEVVTAFKTATDTYGCGAGASHLITGHTRAHHELEESLAEFTNRPRALTFSTGYMATLGLITTLAKRGDCVFEDRYNHASLVDAALLSGARLVRYPHADTNALREKLVTLSGHRRKVIATDGVFSMDGDIAPLTGLAGLAREQEATLVVDDAHGFGVVGTEGRGSLAAAGIGHDESILMMGTLGKAFGVFGAFVAGSDELIELLINRGRTYIYTTAPPAAIAVAAKTAVSIAVREHWRREKLRALVTSFREAAGQLGLRLSDSPTPIQPVIIGDALTALRASAALEERGFLVHAVRPPTVPDGTARLRFTFSAAHEEKQLNGLLDALEAIVPAVA